MNENDLMMNLAYEGRLPYDFFVGKSFNALVFPEVKDMSSFVFHESRFKNVIFISTDFGSSDLTSATFEYCCFQDCSMAKTQQFETVYDGCVFNNTVFKNARLNGVHFKNCIISNSSYEGAIVSESIFEDSLMLDEFNGVSLAGSRLVSRKHDWL